MNDTSSTITHRFPDALEQIPADYFAPASEQGRLEELHYSTWESMSYEQESTPLTKRAIIYLPYGYSEAQKYPVFYLMHGGWSNETTYLGTPEQPNALKNILDNAIAEGLVQPMIVVCPTYNNLSAGDSADYSLAIELTANYHNELVNDLIPAVEGKYSSYAEDTTPEGLAKSRNYRAFAGFSMGSVATWRTFQYCLDEFRYFFPSSGNLTTDGDYMASIVRDSGRSPDEAEAAALSALLSGCRLIDTANAYLNEKAVGRAIRRSGVPREEIFLETKLWPSFYEQADAVDKTLERLGTDYIDMLLLHQPAGNYIAGYRLMERAYKEGKVKAIGLSNFTQAQIKEILDICEVKPSLFQTEVHPYSQEKELKAFLSSEGIVIQAWYPLGHGDKALIEEPLFTELAQKYGKSNVQIILRWHIQAGDIVIPGSKNPAHIKSNFELFDFALTEAEMAQIAALDQKKRYYTSTPELLKKYAEMVPAVDEQK